MTKNTVVMLAMLALGSSGCMAAYDHGNDSFYGDDIEAVEQELVFACHCAAGTTLVLSETGIECPDGSNGLQETLQDCDTAISCMHATIPVRQEDGTFIRVHHTGRWGAVYYVTNCPVSRPPSQL